MAASRLRVRFWVESVLAVATGVLAVLTESWPHWIERVFGFDPDHGDGSAEWLIVVVLAAVTVVLFGAARAEWARARLTRDGRRVTRTT